MMSQSDITIPATIQQELDRVHHDGNSSMVLVAIDDHVQGALEFDFPIRDEIHDMISQMKKRGITYLGIVSGDQQAPTEKLAKALGIEHCFYNVLPEDKANLVETLQAEGKKVCFVGDGVNDSIAMKKADVSISMKGATSVATDLAQVILLDGSLRHIDYLFDVSIHLNKSIHQSLMFCGTYSAATLASALLFLLGPGSILAVGSMQYAAALFHAMRSTKKINKDQ
jgi:Cu2+-exporting ATPase